MRPVLMFLAALPLVAQPLTPDQWRADLAVLAKELPSRHTNPFTHITKAAFEKEVRELDARIPRLSEAQVRAGILQVITSIGDGHTGVWSQGRLEPFHVLPLGLYWFKDGIFVTSVSEEHRDLLGAKVERIGKMTIEEAGRALEPLVVHENNAELRLGLPGVLVNADLLFAMNVTDSLDHARVEVTAPSGRRVSTDLQSSARADALKMVSAFTGEQPLHRKNNSLNYWATTLDEGVTVHFQYNRCAEDPKQPFRDFRERLRVMLSQRDVKRLIVDLRYNAGGNSARSLDPRNSRRPVQRQG